MSSDFERPRVLVTVHGIRTFGEWSARLGRLVRSQSPDHRTEEYGYGYFSALAFLVPLLRWIEVRRLRRRLMSLSALYTGAVFDIVAHSFGTYLVGHMLRSTPSAALPAIRTVILAGSVLPSSFDWASVIEARKVRRVVNDCGVDDDVLIVSQLAVLFTGMAGRVGFHGFQGAALFNRFHVGGHSLYFSDDFMSLHWVPLLTSGDPPRPIDVRTTPNFNAGLVMWVVQNFTFVKLALYVAIPALIVHDQWQRYQTQQALQLAAEAEGELALGAASMDRALRLALASVTGRPTPSGRQALEHVLAPVPEQSMAVAFSGSVGPMALDDSGRVGVVGIDGGAVIMETQGWRVRHRVKFDSTVTRVAISRDGGLAFAADESGNLAFWRTNKAGSVEADSKVELLRDVLAARFSADGRTLHLLTAREPEPSATLHRFDARTGEELAQTELETGPVTAGAIGVDGQWVVVATSDVGYFSSEPHDPSGAVQVWNGKTSKQVAAFRSSNQVTTVAIGIGDTRVAAGDEFGMTQVWERSTGNVEVEFWRPQPVKAVEFGRFEAELETPEAMTVKEIMSDRSAEHALVAGYSKYPDALLASVPADGAVSVLSLYSRREVARLPHRHPVGGVAFSPQDRLLLTGSGKTMRGWAPASGAMAAMELNSAVQALAIGPAGKTVLAAGQNGLWRAWNRTTGRQVAQLLAISLSSDSPQFGVAAFASGPRTAYLLAQSDSALDSAVVLWDALSGFQELRMKPEKGLAALATSADGLRAAVADNAGSITLLGLERIEVLTTLKSTPTISAVGLSPDGDWVVAGHKDGAVDVWRRSDGLHRRWHGPLPVAMVAVAAGGRHAIADDAGGVSVRDPDGGRPLFQVTGELQGGPQTVKALAFGDSDHLAWAAGRAVHVAQLSDDKVVAELKAGGPVSLIVFGPQDGRLYYAMGNRILLWPWDLRAMVRAGCVQLGIPDAEGGEPRPTFCASP